MFVCDCVCVGVGVGWGGGLIAVGELLVVPPLTSTVAGWKWLECGRLSSFGKAPVFFSVLLVELGWMDSATCKALVVPTIPTKSDVSEQTEDFIEETHGSFQ